MSDSLKILKDFTDRMKKSMSPEVLHSLIKRRRMESSAPEFAVIRDNTVARELGSRSRGGNFERIILPTEIATPSPSVFKGDLHSDCSSCGYMYKSSIKTCPRCAPKNEVKEAVPFYKR